MKRTTGTQTMYGHIAHRRNDALGVDMPVALRISGRGLLLSDHQRPELSADGHLVYVLPGGRRWFEPPMSNAAPADAAFGSLVAALA